jgi:ketopantoate reductase
MITLAVAASGLRLTDLKGYRHHLERVFWYTAPPQISSAAQAPGLVLLCVKSAATAQAATELAAVLPPGTLVLSLQNGVDNARVAQTAAPALRVRAGMVPFNVTERAPGHLHQGTSGELAAQSDPQLQPWLPLFAQAGLPLDLHPDLGAVQWGKLLLNLNNPVNALSGLPLRAQLLTRDWRCCTAALMAEGKPFAWRLSLKAARDRLGGFERLTWVEETSDPGMRTARPEVLGDMVVGRKDIGAGYVIASVLDDAEQGVTHVIRGEDLIQTTSIQRVLQALLDLPTPVYRHHRLLLGPDGKRYAKRDGSVTKKMVAASTCR